MRLLKNIAFFSLLTPALVSCGGDSVSINDRLATATVLRTPGSLWAEMKINKLRVEQKYDGEYLFIKGVVESVEKDHFWISFGNWDGGSYHIKCDVDSKNRTYHIDLNVADRVVAFGRYEYNNFKGLVVGLVGELDHCVWNARAKYKGKWLDYLDGWDDAMNLTKAKRVIKNAPFVRNSQGDLRKDTNPLYNPRVQNKRPVTSSNRESNYVPRTLKENKQRKSNFDALSNF